MSIHTAKPIRSLLLLPLLCGMAWAQPPAPGAAVAIGPSAVETNPAVRAALELPRETPADYFQAVIWLIDLGRPELAKPILEELTKLQLTDAQRAALVAEFGSRDMLRLARAAELAPAGAEFADASMAAAAAAANDPQRIAMLAAPLTDPSPDARQMARTDLAATGQLGATATLEALAKEADSDGRAALMTAAARMHPLVDRPLLAMLDTNDPALRADVIALLQHLRVPQAAPFIQVGPASAERELTAAIQRIQEGTPPLAVDEANHVELWHWDDVAKSLSSARYPADEARVIWLARLAGDLLRLRPQDRQALRNWLVLELEAAYYLPPRAIDPLAMADLPLVNEVLIGALESEYAYAAEAAIDALARSGDWRLVLTADAQPSPLANALGDADRRVRFAALRAIMALDPPSPYPGSSRVPDALSWFAGSRGERQALVAMPTLEASANLAGMLAAHDLDALATNRGRDAVELARDMADLEMIFLDMNILRPDIRQVVYELRLSPETRHVPVALLAAEGRLEGAERLAAEHERVIAVPRVHSHEVLERVVERLIEMAGRNPVTPAERAAQAAEAAAWLDKLAATRPFYTIRRSELLRANESRQTISNLPPRP